MTNNATDTGKERKKIRILIVDDSWVLRQVLRGTVAQRGDMEIVGEATNGIEALDLLLKYKPDVILLDVEMPIMDGMTSLQHLMIHTPTPTIMLSGLSEVGTPRCFDALKYGAVDFVSKNSFFQGIDGTAHSKMVIGKILAAAAMSVSPVDPMRNAASIESRERTMVVFCEECGTRHSVTGESMAEFVQCRNCGEKISAVPDRRYQRMSCMSIIGAGESGYGNLLKIIPPLRPEMGGSILVVINDNPEAIVSFVGYLDSISKFQVALGEDGGIIEGGCCYLLSAQDNFVLAAGAGQYRFRINQKARGSKKGAIDAVMESSVALLGSRVSGVLVSGSGSDGTRGMLAIKKHSGNCMVLSPERCLDKSMVNCFTAHDESCFMGDEQVLGGKIQKYHFANKETVVTA